MLNSIRVKLTLWYIGVLALILIAFGAVTYSLFVRVLRDETNANIKEVAGNVVASVKSEQGDGERNRPPEKVIDEALSELRFRDYQVAIFSRDNTLVSLTTDIQLPSDFSSSIGRDKFGDFSIIGEAFRVYEQEFWIKDQNFRLYVFHSLADQIALEERIRRILYLVVPLLVLLAGIGGYFLARKSLKPIAAMGSRATRISVANLHERLPVTNAKDELGNLAIIFNELLDRLTSNLIANGALWPMRRMNCGRRSQLSAENRKSRC